MIISKIQSIFDEVAREKEAFDLKRTGVSFTPAPQIFEQQMSQPVI